MRGHRWHIKDIIAMLMAGAAFGFALYLLTPGNQ